MIDGRTPCTFAVPLRRSGSSDPSSAAIEFSFRSVVVVRFVSFSPALCMRRVWYFYYCTNERVPDRLYRSFDDSFRPLTLETVNSSLDLVRLGNTARIRRLPVALFCLSLLLLLLTKRNRTLLRSISNFVMCCFLLLFCLLTRLNRSTKVLWEYYVVGQFVWVICFRFKLCI